jgi:hypothetical protein
MSDTVRLPRSSSRNAYMVFAKLLTKVDSKAHTGFGFEGTLLRPGTTIPLAELWPDPSYPKIPTLLECAGTINPKDGSPGKRYWPTLYILWQYDLKREQWREIARASSCSWDWAVDLRPIAVRLLEEARGTVVEVYSGLPQVVDRIDQALEMELGRLSPLDRGRVVGALHDHLCARLGRLEHGLKDGL